MTWTLNSLSNECHAIARSKGFYEHDTVNGLVNPSLPAEKLALLHSEISEVLDRLRDGDREGEAEECVDVLIRLLDYMAWRDVDIDSGLELKMAKNRDRPRLHGRAF